MLQKKKVIIGKKCNKNKIFRPQRVIMRGEGRGASRRRELSCPMISCHINIFDLLIIGEYHAAEVGTSLQYEF